MQLLAEALSQGQSTESALAATAATLASGDAARVTASVMASATSAWYWKTATCEESSLTT